MVDQRLKQFEKSLKDKIAELTDFAEKSDKEHLERYGSYSITAFACEKEVGGYQGALKLLYSIYPELKEDKN